MAPPGACYELGVSPHGAGGPGPAELTPSLKRRVEPAGLFLNQDTSEHLKEHAEADGEPPSSGFNLDTRHEPNDKNTERRQAGRSALRAHGPQPAPGTGWPFSEGRRDGNRLVPTPPFADGALQGPVRQAPSFAAATSDPASSPRASAFVGATARGVHSPGAWAS